MSYREALPIRSNPIRRGVDTRHYYLGLQSFSSGAGITLPDLDGLFRGFPGREPLVRESLVTEIVDLW